MRFALSIALAQSSVCAAPAIKLPPVLIELRPHHTEQKKIDSEDEILFAAIDVQPKRLWSTIKSMKMTIKNMKTKAINTVLILALGNGLSLTAYSESDSKTHLRFREELALPDDSQLHVAEILDKPRLVWPVDALFSGILPLSQTKFACYEASHPFSNGLLVNILLSSD